MQDMPKNSAFEVAKHKRVMRANAQNTYLPIWREYPKNPPWRIEEMILRPIPLHLMDDPWPTIHPNVLHRLARHEIRQEDANRHSAFIERIQHIIGRAVR
jgi:hypothetical protein